ncbi:acyl-CoA:lysophosphatidylglycerol acyltransferase 1 isoform X3 [Natator depressus]
MMLVNHQATGDVCTLMMCLQDKGTVVRQMMWLMDHIFKYTNFGIVSLIHGDFFIKQGKAHRDQQLVLLKEHLDKHYRSRDRKWIVLFPEGGFLRKRRETSQAFSKKNNLPFLTHVTLPRLGATQVILKSLVAQQENGTPAGGDAMIAESKSKGLQWVIDTTIAYPNEEPIDIQTWILGYRRPTVTHVYYRMRTERSEMERSLCEKCSPTDCQPKQCLGRSVPRLQMVVMVSGAKTGKPSSKCDHGEKGSYLKCNLTPSPYIFESNLLASVTKTSYLILLALPIRYNCGIVTTILFCLVHCRQQSARS